MTRWSMLLAACVFALPAPSLAQTRDLNGWSGFYVGIDLGLASGKLHASGSDDVFQVTNINPPGPQPLTVVPSTSFTYAGSDRQMGLLYGATAGFLVRSGHWLFGAEADGHGSRDAGAVSTSFAKPATILEPASRIDVARAARISWDWSVRARAGYTWGPGMIYVAGGVASARVRLRGEDSYTQPGGNAAPNLSGGGPVVSPAFGPISETVTYRGTLTGWTAGMGGERRLSRHISIGLDGRYTDYGNRVFDLSGCTVAASGLCRVNVVGRREEVRALAGELATKCDRLVAASFRRRTAPVHTRSG